MTAHRAKNKTTAMKAAARARAKGFKATPFKTKKGWNVSVTRR